MTESNKGFEMMAKLGFKKGMTLGSTRQPEQQEQPLYNASNRLTEPIPIVFRTGNAGIGLGSSISASTSTAKTNSISTDSHDTQHVPSAEEFRENQLKKQNERRTLKELEKARQTVQTLDEMHEVGRTPFWPDDLCKLSAAAGDGDATDMADGFHYVLQDDDTDEAGRKEEDVIANRFTLLKDEDKLAEILCYLRSTYYYCLYCGDRFSSTEELMSLCPGETRDVHDE